MKLSRIINSLDELPKELSDYYEIDDQGRYALQVSGMVPKAKLKEFRESNIKLGKENNELKEKLQELEAEKTRLTELIDSQRNLLNQKDEQQLISQINRKSKSIANTFRKYSCLKRIDGKDEGFELCKAGDKALIFEGKRLRIDGRFLKVLRLRSESYEYMDEIELLTEILKNSDHKIDVLTFIQEPPNSAPIYSCYMEMDNLAVIPVSTFDHWWNNQIKDKTRNLVRKAEKNNVIARKASLDDQFIEGIHKIFNESAIRQGRKFPHFGKNLLQIKNEISTFPDKSDFIGAYYDKELIGFIKIVYSRNCANLMQILSMIGSRDKAPTNALLAKAVEITAEKKLGFLVYRKFEYGNKGADQLTEFKVNNGFIKFEVPRYFVPYSAKGKIALKLKMHRKLNEIIPKSVYSRLMKLRNFAYNLRFKNAGGEL